MEKEIYFAGGCFWGVEEFFSQIDGVEETLAGYANGRTKRPNYEEVCRQNTGHAETVKVVYRPETIALSDLLSLFYEIIDPTSRNRQGPDRGEQYRCGVYYVDGKDEPVIRASLKELQKEYDRPLVVEVQPLAGFYPAEELHQKYLRKNPFGYCHIKSDAFQKAREFQSPPRFLRKSRETLYKKLTPMQFDVTQNGATEPPYQNEFYRQFEEGIYVDITTGEPLFLSCDKFDSGCGWPSFSKPISDDLLIKQEDNRFHMRRTEVRSKTGDAHLGHVFSDGPRELGGLRYCINSASLRFIRKSEMSEQGYGDYLALFLEKRPKQNGL